MNSNRLHRWQSPVRLLMTVGFALCAFSNVQAECSPDPGSTTILIDATSGCANIVGQVGCTIEFNKGQSSCVANTTTADGKTVAFSASASILGGRTVWNTSAPIDTAIINGATKGNNCGYSYTYDVKEGSGGFLKGDGTYQNTNSVSLCSDGVLENPPPPPEVAEPFPDCDDISRLDQTTVACDVNPEKSLVCNFQLEQPNAGAQLGEYCCVCGVENQEVCVAGTGECDTILGDGDGRKEVGIDQGELIEFLYTPGCIYSRATNRWICT